MEREKYVSMVSRIRADQLTKIESVVHAAVERAANISELTIAYALEHCMWAIHPDGTKDLLHDGVVILTITPPEIVQTQTEFGYKMTLEQKFIRRNSAT